MTKSQLTQRCRDILHGSKPYQPINPEDQVWLIENVFKFHPEWDWWNDQGVDFIQPEHYKEKYKSLCFFIHFKNGGKADISFTKSIKNIDVNKG